MKKYTFSMDFTYEGKRYKVRADSQPELYKKYADKLRELEEDSAILSPSTTVNKWADRAFDTYKKDNTNLEQMKLRFKKYASPVIGSIPISKVTSIQCQDILNKCSGMSFSHLDKLRQELRFVFRSAMNNGLIKRNPADDLTLPEYSKGQRRSITDHERKHLYKVCDAYEPFLLFLLMLECGCRPGEARGLQGRDIDHGQKLLHIRGTKTDNSDRYVPIPDRLYARIKDTAAFDHIVVNTLGHPYNRDAYVKLSHRLKRELNISMGCKVYRNALVPPYPLADDFEPYCLRHTYCTDLCKSGVDVRTAQRLMGHATIAITADIYTHVDTDQIVSAGELLNSYLESIK